MLKAIIEGIKVPANMNTCMKNDQQILHQTSDDIQEQNPFNNSTVVKCNEESHGMFEYGIINFFEISLFIILLSYFRK
jgi:hypothetical protein